MSIPVNVKGIWRESESKVCVNGVWRNTEQWGHVNGVWRRPKGSTTILKAEDIRGFRFVYNLEKDKSYNGLKFNGNIPITIDLAGETPNEYNASAKSFIIQYSNDRPDEEGIIKYIGLMYIDMIDGSVFPISELYDSPLSTDTRDLSITIDAHSVYESYGPAVMGWNSILSSDENIPDSDGVHKNIKYVNSYNILPTYKRDAKYRQFSSIGIERNMTSGEKNMVGSYGLLDHTIDQVSVNGEAKPLVIEVYN